MLRNHRLTRGPLVSPFLLALVSCTEDVRSPMDASPEPTLATLSAPLSFAQVSGGSVHTCALTTESRAYCWGANFSGELGTGSETGPETCEGAVGPFGCSTRPAPVAGSRLFRQISAGGSHTCAVATDRRAFCWGSNSQGRLGDGTQTDRPSPALVRGGLRFYGVAVGLQHTCGVSYPDRRAYCWGSNGQGQLGDGTRTARSAPVPVSGNRQFRMVSAGNFHTCGVTTSNEAYCWGFDQVGQLGNDAERTRRTKPALVAGGHQFRQVDAGASHTCGVTTGDRAYCWGLGGQIGDGKVIDRFTPRLVAGGLSFSRVSAGTRHTCAETTANRAYCWGSNRFGQLGDGGPPDMVQLRPLAVAGGLAFAQLSAGGSHTCGKTGGSVGYCWGDDFFGQLGVGNSGVGAESRTPTPVAGPS
jgi:alpha-tubulin suppressor-like RCC1 family protein